MNDKTLITFAAIAGAFWLGVKFQQRRAARADASLQPVTQDGFWFATYNGLWH